MTMSEAVPPSLAVLRAIVLLGLQLRQVSLGDNLWKVQGAKEVEICKQDFVLLGN